MSDKLRCSIVINTYNRASFLERLLAAFHHLSYDHFEVVVVNGPSTDWTTAVLSNYEERIKVVDCPEANLSLSRNIGIAAATGDIIVFIDDDAIPGDPDWLIKIVQTFQDDMQGEIGAAGGASLHRDTPYYEFRGGLTSDYAFQIFREEEMTDQALDENRWFRRTVGCNSAFRRSALQEIGGFDEYFIYYLDESDVCLRMARAGYKTHYLEDCPVRHYPAQSPHGAPFIRNRRLITRSDTYYCLKNGSDGLLQRFLKTLWFAPQKHFVREMPELWRNGLLSTGGLISFIGQWGYGLLAGLRIGLFARRRNRLSTIPPPTFLPFRKNSSKEKLCICLLSDLLPPEQNIGGIARYTWDLASGLHELGHEVHIITRSEKHIRHENLEFVVHGLASDSWTSANLFPDKPTLNNLSGYSLVIFEKLMDLASEGVIFDVVETPNWDLEGLATALAQVYPTVLRVHSPLVKVCEIEGWEVNDDLRACIALEKWLIANVNAVTASTKGVIETCRKQMDVDVEKLPIFHKIPLGLKPGHLLSPMEGKTQKRLLYVGRFEYRKGTNVLLAVLPELMARFHDWECFLVGSNTSSQASEWINDFERKYAKALWRSRVHITGTVSDEKLQYLYQSCDLFVAPSLYESFGIVYMEAMQYGKPVVGCHVGGIPEVVTQGVDGLLVEPGNEMALLNALSRLMSDDELRDKMGREGKAKVDKELNHLAMAKGMAALYQEAIKKADEGKSPDISVIVPLIHKKAIEVNGEWQEKRDARGKMHLYAEKRGSSISFSGRGGSFLNVVALCHDWGGVLTVNSGVEQPNYLDLFSESQEENIFRLKLPGTSRDEVNVRLTVHPERNPRSISTQVWLRRVLLTGSEGALGMTTAGP